MPNGNLCEVCMEDKQARYPFNRFKDKNYTYRKRLFTGVCVPITPSSVIKKNSVSRSIKILLCHVFVI